MVITFQTLYLNWDLHGKEGVLNPNLFVNPISRGISLGLFWTGNGKFNFFLGLTNSRIKELGMA